MSGIVKTVTGAFFGGAEKDAAKAQTQALEQGQQITKESAAQARADLFKLFPAAQQNVQQGFQGALDVFGQSLPAQLQAFQGGNVAAQEQLISGLPQFQNAILGGNVDFSQFQPTQLQQPDLSFFQQQLAQPVDPFAPGPAQMIPATPGTIGLGGQTIGPNVGIQDFLSGRFNNKF